MSSSLQSLTVIEGTVQGLQRTTHISGGGETAATTTHITLFSIGSHRVELRQPSPPPLADGDQVRLAGETVNGVFLALACRALNHPWTTEVPRFGCLMAVFVVMGMILSTMALGLLLLDVGMGKLLLLPIVAALAFVIWLGYRNRVSVSRSEFAHELIHRPQGATSP